MASDDRNCRSPVLIHNMNDAYFNGFLKVFLDALPRKSNWFLGQTQIGYSFKCTWFWHSLFGKVTLTPSE